MPSGRGFGAGAGAAAVAAAGGFGPSCGGLESLMRAGDGMDWEVCVELGSAAETFSRHFMFPFSVKF